MLAASLPAILLGMAGAQPAPPEIILIPHIGNDHQFNLNYTVAHLAALLDTVQPDALVLYDESEWVKRDCLWQAANPAAHVVLAYARERSLALYGVGLQAEPFAETQKWIADYRRDNPSVDAIRAGTRARLDRETARLASEFHDPPALDTLFRRILPNDAKRLSDVTRQRLQPAVNRLVKGLAPVVKAHRRIAMVVDPRLAVLLQRELAQRGDLRLVPVDSFLPLRPEVVARRMDFKHLTWILSGLVDEWYGMWAPQAFPTERIAGLLQKLDSLAPQHPATRFLRARWLMQNRDFEGAKPILETLAARSEDERFPFPINGKWIRPPWNSVRDKARLNLAFLYDYAGERQKALDLYRQLSMRRDDVDEARAVGYVYDDIPWVLDSYIRTPFSGMPDEAFRHFQLLAKVPDCAPAARR